MIAKSMAPDERAEYILENHADTRGSLQVAIGVAIRDAVEQEKARVVALVEATRFVYRDPGFGDVSEAQTKAALIVAIRGV